MIDLGLRVKKEGCGRNRTPQLELSLGLFYFWMNFLPSLVMTMPLYELSTT